jgi:hypothetical protein
LKQNEEFMTKTFSFVIDDINLKTKFFEILQDYYPELRIIGLENDNNAFNKKGITYAPLGAVVEFKRTKDYDVQWYETDVEAMLEGITPTYSLDDDWYDILDNVDDYYKEKNSVVYYYDRSSRPVLDRLKKPIVFKTRKGVTVKDLGTIIIEDDGYSQQVIPRYVFAKSKLLKEKNFRERVDEYSDYIYIINKR